jgi:hypothetical protein
MNAIDLPETIYSAPMSLQDRMAALARHSTVDCLQEQCHGTTAIPAECRAYSRSSLMVNQPNDSSYEMCLKARRKRSVNTQISAVLELP